MRVILYLILLLTVIACNTNSKSEKLKENENQNEEINENSEITIIQSTSDFQLNGIEWSEIESSGNPDTALTLYTYRILFTKEKELELDCEIRMNLIESSKEVKALLPKIFKGHIEPGSINRMVDSLNQAAIDYAEAQVQKDIEEYGQSDGPCFELYSLKK